MKKIFALIRSSGPLFYFVNQIHRHHPINTVIIEDKSLGGVSVLNKFKAKIALGANAIDNPHVSVRIKSKKMADLYFQSFGDDWLDLDKSLRIVYCKSINDPHIEQLLAEEKPDLLLDHGTSIVKDHIIDKAPFALNLHWGLSPYYRGTHCTEWALINWDPLNIGVTIHRLTKAIDGGDVLGQARVEIETNDSVDSINMKLTIVGTKIIINALHDWQQDKEFQFYQQDPSLGYLILNRQWNRSLKKAIQNIEQKGLITNMLKNPARRNNLPIIEYQPS